MTPATSNLSRALNALRATLFAPALALVGLAVLASAAQADALSFTVDSSQSYLTLNIPNFSLSGLNIALRGQNRTNGAPTATMWSASTNTGNTAFISGTFATTIGGSLTGQTLSSVQFISGANNLVALNSGNYRPNPAAYNSATSVYDNNSAAPAAYGSVVYTGATGNGALTSFSNVTYDLGGNNLPASGGVGSGSFTTGSDLTAGILTSTFSVQGLTLLLVGQVLPNAVEALDPLTAANTLPGATYTFTSPTNLQFVIPINIPIALDVGTGPLTANAFGQIVGNATVPEPSTIALAGLGTMCLVAVVRRRRQASKG